MLIYAQIKSNRRKFLALTGLTPREFQLVLPTFKRAYRRCYPATKTVVGEGRQRQAGGGRKTVLDTTEQKLLFALVYLKTYPLQLVLGEMFELSQPRANVWIHRLLPVLQQALRNLGVRPERSPRQFSRSERRRGEPREFIIDGTERRRQRPKNKAIRDDFYSPHKKAHTDKNLVISQRKTKRVAFLSQTYRGRVHDKKMADTERIQYPRGSREWQDTGFQGYAPRGVETLQPKKAAQRSAEAGREATQSALGPHAGAGGA
ncbi:MAG: transposase [Chloroflexota bacterium]|nr:transposase [Chloroflexota bacterium]